MRPRDLGLFLSAAAKAGHPVLVQGPPGVGKTEISKQAAKSIDFDYIPTHPVVEDATNAMGLPFPNAERTKANFLPFGKLHRILNSERPTLWNMDDLGQATAAVQAANMQWLLARECGEHKLPDHVSMVACTNRRTDRAGVQGLLEPVKSRFLSIVLLEVHIDDWTNWALDNSINAELIAYLRMRTMMLHGWTVFCNRCQKTVITSADCPECKTALQPGPQNDMENHPSPRTWHNVDKILKLNLPKMIEAEAIEGAVGKYAAQDFISFLRVMKEMPSIMQILINPEKAKLPTEPSTKWAVMVGLAAQATIQNFAQVAIYLKRVIASGGSEFASLAINDMTRRDMSITEHDDYLELIVKHKLVDLIRG
jgi:hypothetical protein